MTYKLGMGDTYISDINTDTDTDLDTDTDCKNVYEYFFSNFWKKYATL